MSDQRAWATIEEAAPPRPARSAPPSASATEWRAPQAGNARTGPLPLQPMTVSDVMDGSFKLLKANARNVFLVVAGVMLLPQVVIAYAGRELMSFGLVGLAANPVDGDRLAVILAAVAVNTIAGAVAAGAVSRIAAASYLGRDMSAGAALRVAAKRSGALLGAFVLVHLAELSGVIAVGVGVLLTLPFFMTMFVLVTPVVVVEEVGPIAAMRRSWRLVRPRFWSVLGAALLAGFVSWLLSQVIAAGPTGIALLFGDSLAWVLLAVGGVIATVIATPIVAITVTLLYFDARIRQEGFDLQILAATIRRSAGAV